MANILDKAKEKYDYIVALRREFHMYPELSRQEKETSKRIQRELDKMGIEYVIVGDYGIVATIKGSNTKSNSVVALRADIDALPVLEANDVEYKSKNEGIMHACGHDAHISMLLGAASLLNDNKDLIDGTVKLCFQQAEEHASLHEPILQELEKFNIKSVFAIHIWSEIPVGKVAIKPNTMMASCDMFKIDIQGKGTHGAIPHKGINPILAACSMVNNINAARTYEIDPAHSVVIGIGSIVSGAACNVVPETATIMGSVRTFDVSDRKHILEMLDRVSRTSAEAFNAKSSFELTASIEPVNNDEECTTLAQKSLTSFLGEEALYDFPRLYVSENFGEYLAKYPGVLAFVGGKNDDKGCCFAHHNDRFNIDEDALPIGSALYTQYAIDCLNK